MRRRCMVLPRRCVDSTFVWILHFSTANSRSVSASVNSRARRRGSDKAHWAGPTGAMGDRGTGAAPAPGLRCAPLRSCRLQPPRRVQVGPERHVRPARRAHRRRWILVPGSPPGTRAAEPAGPATPHALLGTGLLEPSPPARADGRPRLRPLRSLGGPECRRAPDARVTAPPYDRGTGSPTDRGRALDLPSSPRLSPHVAGDPRPHGLSGVRASERARTIRLG
jgi:hypothetical protein